LYCALMYCHLMSCTENKRHEIIFIEKPKNPINGKISIYPSNNITYIILG
jgi:hypothetical protein